MRATAKKNKDPSAGVTPRRRRWMETMDGHSGGPRQRRAPRRRTIDKALATAGDRRALKTALKTAPKERPPRERPRSRALEDGPLSKVPREGKRYGPMADGSSAGSKAPRGGSSGRRLGEVRVDDLYPVRARSLWTTPLDGPSRRPREATFRDGRSERPREATFRDRPRPQRRGPPQVPRDGSLKTAPRKDPCSRRRTEKRPLRKVPRDGRSGGALLTDALEVAPDGLQTGLAEGPLSKAPRDGLHLGEPDSKAPFCGASSSGPI
jgi:hypothetical protein